MREDIASLRTEYSRSTLDESSVSKSPFEQFNRWFDAAMNAQITEPNAMVLSTCNQNGHPSSRTVLLKDLTEEGFVFYTNYESRKGRDIAQNNAVSILFPWIAMERQVIVYGKAEKVASETSEAYFLSRPKRSQIGAHVSNQSGRIVNRMVLESKANQLNEAYKERKVLRPENWGGYLVIPYLIEFWQGRSSRLHDRIVYEWEGDFWNVGRLSP